MILRRLTNHVKDQNWFAVAIDFLIVISGILIAFQITNWNEQQQERTELTRAEVVLQTDLAYNYFNAVERVSLTDCRTERLRELAESLMEPGEAWEGMARIDQNSPFPTAIGRVLRSPSRNWGSRLWDTGLARGTFNQMDANRLKQLDDLFKQIEDAEQLQFDILALQSRVKVLSQTTHLSRADRLRYFDIISEIDEQSFWLELISGQIADQIETIGVVVGEELRAIMQEILSPEAHKRREDAYGTCVKRISFPFLENTEAETAP